MSKIEKVLTNTTYDGELRKRLVNIFSPSEIMFVDENDSKGIKEAAEICDVAFLKGNLTKDYLNGELKWIHCNIAGLNGSTQKEVFRKGIILTGAAGRSSPSLAEHAFFFMLNHAYDIKKTLQAQKSHQWGFEGIANLQSLYGKTVGIIGFGNTGKAIYKKACSFGMRISAYNNSPIPESFSLLGRYSVKQGDTPEALLRQSDYVVLSVGLNDNTYHLLDEKSFSLMKPTAYLVNLSRGEIIDEKAMIKALREKRISGAGLDVFEQEPLPADSPLWDMDSVLITPHRTPMMGTFQSRCLDILEENVRRYRADVPLLNVADESDIFSR